MNNIKKYVTNPVFLEITAAAIVLVAINVALFPRDPGFRGLLAWLPIHPFIILILLAAVRYGTGWGLYAAILSTAYFLIVPPLTMADLAIRLPGVATFFALLLIFGQIHDRFAGKISDLTRQHEESEKKYQTLNENFELTSFIKENYEKKLLTQTTTMADLYKDAEKMQVLEIDELHGEITGIARKYLEAEKCSLYMLEGGGLVLKSHRGYEKSDAPPPAGLDLRDEPYRLILEEKKMVSINEAQFKETVISNIPVYSAPLIDNRDNVIGIINVDALSMLKFNATTRQAFLLISSWASKALDNALAFRESESRRIIDPEFGIFRSNYFLARLTEALQNARDTGARFTFMGAEIQDWDKIPEKNRKGTYKFVSRIIAQSIRDYDILAKSRKENELWILMPGASKEGVEKFIQKLGGEMSTINLKPFGDETGLRLRISHGDDFSKATGSAEIIAEALGAGGTHVDITAGE